MSFCRDCWDRHYGPHSTTTCSCGCHQDDDSGSTGKKSVFYVDVGDLSPKEAKRTIDRIRREFVK